MAKTTELYKLCERLFAQLEQSTAKSGSRCEIVVGSRNRLELLFWYKYPDSSSNYFILNTQQGMVNVYAVPSDGDTVVGATEAAAEAFLKRHMH